MDLPSPKFVVDEMAFEEMCSTASKNSRYSVSISGMSPHSAHKVANHLKFKGDSAPDDGGGRPIASWYHQSRIVVKDSSGVR